MRNGKRLTNTKLLETRLRDLELGAGDKAFQLDVRRVEAELRQRGFTFPVTFGFSTEWFVTQGSRTVAVPFYLANARLRGLARKELGQGVDGLLARERARIWRHELGHVIANSLRVTTRPGFKAHFGKLRPYPRTYLPKPYSHQFVKNLSDGYAQSHPDEDFAETFAVWLDPKSHWVSRYRGTPADAKLTWVEAFLAKVPSSAKKWIRATSLDDLAGKTLTVRQFFAQQRLRRGRWLPPALSRDLPKVLSSTPRQRLRVKLARESGCYLYQIDWLLRNVTPRPGGLSGDERKELTQKLARNAARYFESGRSPLFL